MSARTYRRDTSLRCYAPRTTHAHTKNPRLKTRKHGTSPTSHKTQHSHPTTASQLPTRNPHAARLVIRGASAGESCAVVLLSPFFSEHTSGLASRPLPLLDPASLTVHLVVTPIRATHSRWLSRTATHPADTSAQLRIRLTMMLIVSPSAPAMHLGIKAVLSAFVAGTVLRLADPDAETRHPHFHTTLNGIGYSFLVPVFFITSGIQFDLVAALRRRNHRPTGAAPPHGPAARPRTSRTDSPQGGPLTRATRRRRTPAGHDPRP
ncbi:hypothetical protein G3I22_26290 [Actinospica acidiphila]|nr:hypothetical protein [Actinospica acidiphila]